MSGLTMRTRWGRASAMTAVGFLCLGGMGTAIYTSAFGLNANLIIQNDSMSFASRKIVAQDVGFGVTAVKHQNGSWRNVLRAGFATASMDGLCVSQTESIPIVGNVTVKLTAGDNNASTMEISANNAAFDLTSLRAAGTGIELQGTVQMGLATPDITTVPGAAPFQQNPLGEVPSGNGMLQDYQAGVYSAGSSGLNGNKANGQGWTGVDATKGTLTTVRGTLWQAQVVGNVVLPRLSITVGSASSCETDAANGTFP